MAAAPAETAPAGQPRAPKAAISGPKRAYLVAYNALSAVLWSVVLVRTVQALYTGGPKAVYPAVGEWTKWTQTLAALEIVHSLLGVVRAPLSTTAMQVASRFALVWGAVHFYPATALSPAYSSMLLAWSVTEVVRYLFFALSLSGWEPAALRWQRYSGFYVLYPVGIASELWLIFVAGCEARYADNTDAFILSTLVMSAYPFGAPTLFKHMRAQRRKVLGGGGAPAVAVDEKKTQ
ncbi:hypothetical protein VPNG_03867 [Cytospora leucostoma]|uniref:Very-long-chain (3R)-3-hydroxyacyl-CoA dehydratase n=1 Tax=Cytospora leucostoma TaxID=1230097 RepID=A0A423XEB7_9PEZI|nr:hypothetical protein VPNG_03867 [Cytospora leucostoma]